MPDLRTTEGKRTPRTKSTRLRIVVRLASLAQPALRRVCAAACVLGLATIGDGFIYLSLTDAGSPTEKLLPAALRRYQRGVCGARQPYRGLADTVSRARVFLIGYIALLAIYALTASGVTGGAWSMVIALLLMGSFLSCDRRGVISARNAVGTRGEPGRLGFRHPGGHPSALPHGHALDGGVGAADPSPPTIRSTLWRREVRRAVSAARRRHRKHWDAGRVIT